jgi:hypothetical protein
MIFRITDKTSITLHILFQEGNVEKMRQNVPENIEGKVVPSQVLKQDIIIDRVKAATMKVPLVISELNTNAVIDTGAEVTVLSLSLFSPFLWITISELAGIVTKSLILTLATPSVHLSVSQQIHCPPSCNLLLEFIVISFSSMISRHQRAEYKCCDRHRSRGYSSERGILL